MNQIKSDLVEKLQAKTAVMAVLGLGYVGLPLAVVFAEAGFTVIGVDPVQEKVDLVNRGESYVLDVPAATVARLVAAGKLRASSDFSVLHPGGCRFDLCAHPAA